MHHPASFETPLFRVSPETRHDMQLRHTRCHPSIKGTSQRALGADTRCAKVGRASIGRRRRRSASIRFLQIVSFSAPPEASNRPFDLGFPGIATSWAHRDGGSERNQEGRTTPREDCSSSAAAAIARFLDAPLQFRGRSLAHAPSHPCRRSSKGHACSRRVGSEREKEEKQPTYLPSKSKESRKKVFRLGGACCDSSSRFDFLFHLRPHFSPSPFTTTKNKNDGSLRLHAPRGARAAARAAAGAAATVSRGCRRFERASGLSSTSCCFFRLALPSALLFCLCFPSGGRRRGEGGAPPRRRRRRCSLSCVGSRRRERASLLRRGRRRGGGSAAERRGDRRNCRAATESRSAASAAAVGNDLSFLVFLLPSPLASHPLAALPARRCPLIDVELFFFSVLVIFWISRREQQ